MATTTQSERFWRESWYVDDDDMERLLEVFIEENRPLTTDELAQEYLRQLVSYEQDRQEAAGAELYDPTHAYDTGTRLSFPQLDGAIGEVVDVREGYNPRYDDFSVVQIQFEEDDTIREFAANFQNTYALNFDAGAALVELSPEELYKQHGAIIRQKLSVALEESDDFAHFGQRWIPTVLLPDINPGNLNIAEAMIDVTGAPLTTDELLKEMEVGADIPKPIVAFAVDLTMSGDERFINLGGVESPRWSLQRLQ